MGDARRAHRLGTTLAHHKPGGSLRLFCAVGGTQGTY